MAKDYCGETAPGDRLGISERIHCDRDPGHAGDHSGVLYRGGTIRWPREDPNGPAAQWANTEVRQHSSTPGDRYGKK